MRRHKKGKTGELEIMHILRDDYGYPVRRGYVACKEPDIVGLTSIHIECKYQKTVDVSGWMTQSIIAAQKYQDGLPVVMFRQVSQEHRGLPWLVLMRYDDYEQMGGKFPRLMLDSKSSFPAGGIYERLKKAHDGGFDGFRFYRLCGEVVCLDLEDWIDLYGAWALPFTE